MLECENEIIDGTIVNMTIQTIDGVIFLWWVLLKYHDEDKNDPRTYAWCKGL